MPRIPIVKPYTQINTPADFPPISLPTGIPIIVVATTPRWEIGHDNTIPWKHHLDLMWFKHLTTQGINPTVIMGRKTFDSLNRRILPNRKNIVVTRNTHDTTLLRNDLEITHDLHSTIESLEDSTIFVIGGAEIYRQVYELYQNRPCILIRSIIPYRHQIPMDTVFPFIPKGAPLMYYFRTNTEQLLIERYTEL